MEGELRKKKTSSFVLGTTGAGAVSTVYTVHAVVGLPKITDAPNPSYESKEPSSCSVSPQFAIQHLFCLFLSKVTR